jgi:hypothetical protein
MAAKKTTSKKMAVRGASRKKPHSRSIPVVPYIPEDMQVVFADGMYITNHEGMFIISFVQTEHPLIQGRTVESGVDQVRSKCVARIALSPRTLSSTVVVMKDMLDQFIQQVAAKRDEQFKQENE